MPRKSKAKTNSPLPKETVTVEPETKTVVPVEPETKTVVPVEPEPSMSDLLDDRFKELSVKMSQLKLLENSIMSEIKSLQKDVHKHMKNMSKKKRKKSSNKNRTPSGFAKPTLMSKELCKFLETCPNTLMARTEVTKHITKYIADKNLQNPENRREIFCDKKLRKLLQIDKDVTVTYFNLQKYMKVHFKKNTDTTSAVEV